MYILCEKNNKIDKLKTIVEQLNDTKLFNDLKSSFSKPSTFWLEIENKFELNYLCMNNYINQYLFDLKDNLNITELLSISEKETLFVLGYKDIIINSKQFQKEIWEEFNNITELKNFISNLNSEKPIYCFSSKNEILVKTLKELKEEIEILEKKALEPKEFKGDILITDPCYILKDRDESNKPKWDDYFTHKDIYSYEDYDGENSKLFEKHYALYDKAYEKWDKENPEDDIDDLPNLGFTNFMIHNTLYGDWSCTTFSEDNQKLGTFCADAGLVGVFLVDEVLKYNPSFKEEIDEKSIVTIIPNFEGNIQFQKIDENTLIVKGTGNVNFFTKQTGF